MPGDRKILAVCAGVLTVAFVGRLFAAATRRFLEVTAGGVAQIGIPRRAGRVIQNLRPPKTE